MCASDHDYDPKSNPIPIRKIGFLEKIYMIVVGLFSVPIAFLHNTSYYDKPNPINNKNNVIGIKRNAVSKDF
jgi:hypothetical protein